MNSTTIYKQLCRISCGDKVGTGLLIDKDKVITATHVLAEVIEEPDTEIIAVFEGEKKIALRLISHELSKYPVVVLATTEDVDCENIYFGKQELSEDDTVNVYGYLHGMSQAGRYTLGVNKCLSEPSSADEYSNAIFCPDAAERTTTFDGLSGAPIVKDRYIVGVILRQQLENRKATRLYGATGNYLKDLLREQGYAAKVPNILITNQSGNNRKRDFLLEEMSIHFERDLEGIREIHDAGNIKESLEKFQTFADDLDNSVYAGKDKAKYYYQGAVWAIAANKQESAKYLKKAVKEDPDIDISLYEAYESFNKGEYGEAQNRIQRMDSPEKLALYLESAFRKKDPLAEVAEVIEKFAELMTDQSYCIAGLIALSGGNYTRAREYIAEGMRRNSNSIKLLISGALVEYWEAVDKIFPNVDRNQFLIYSSSTYFVPTAKQKQNLLRAYRLLENAYELISTEKENMLWQVTTGGLMIISTMIPEMDPMQWISICSKNRDMIPAVVAFMIACDIKIPEDYIETLRQLSGEKRSGISLQALLQFYMYTDAYDDALKLVEEYGDIIAEVNETDVLRIKVDVLISAHRYEDAEKLLPGVKLTNEERFRYRLALLNKGDKKITKKLAEEVVRFAASTKKSLDFENAHNFCQRNNKWKLVEKNAKEWYEATGELCALEYIALAQERQNRENKALRTIRRAEELGDVSENIRQIKLNCLVGLSQYYEAIELAEQFDNCRQNKKIVIFRARSYLEIGKSSDALRILQQYADEGQYDLEICKMLVELLIPENPDEAFRQAYNLYRNCPKDEEILRFAGMVGMMTNHGELRDVFQPILEKDVKKGDVIRAVNIQEVREIFEKNRQHNEEIVGRYNRMEIPIHILADGVTNKNLGAICCGMLEKDGSWKARYIGRDIAGHQLSANRIIVDYTACLTLFKLEQFPLVISTFSEVMIPDTLLRLMGEDVRNLKNMHGSIEENARDMIKELEKVTYVKMPMNHSEILAEESEYSDLDAMTVNYAKENDAYIVWDKPIGEVNDLLVPDEWYQYQVYPWEFYEKLKELGMPYPKYEKGKESINGGASLGNPTTVILDEKIIQELIDAKALAAVTEYYTVAIPENLLEDLARKAQQAEWRESNARWLESVYKQLSKLYEEGKVKICRQYRGNVEPQQKYSRLLLEEIQYAEEYDCDILCDDCYITQYTAIGEPSKTQGQPHIFLSTYDLLKLLYRYGRIERNEFYRNLDAMVAIDYQFLILPTEYLLNKLELNLINEADGKICEKPALKRIRRSVARDLTRGIDSGGQLKETKSISMMYRAYLTQLSMLLLHGLLGVWRGQREDNWKETASKWLLMNLGDIPCEIMSEYQSKRDAILILVGALLIDRRETMKKYLTWIFAQFQVMWVSNPGSINEVAKCVADLTVSDRTSAPNGVDLADWNEYLKSCMLECLREVSNTSAYFYDALLNVPEMKEYRQYCEMDKARKLPRHNEENGDICIEGFVVDETIFEGKPEYLNEVTQWVVDNPRRNGEIVLDLFTEGKIIQIPRENCSRLEDFFFNLSWYLPDTFRGKALEKKRLLTIAETNE